MVGRFGATGGVRVVRRSARARETMCVCDAPLALLRRARQPACIATRDVAAWDVWAMFPPLHCGSCRQAHSQLKLERCSR
eukprot:scaffold8531_cov130-Isochrysis_galbana.AAC.6